MKKNLFLGDSLIEYGDWHNLLPDYRITNRGLGGETVQNLAARLGHELSQAGQPDHLLLMSGTNNLLMDDDIFPAIFNTMLKVTAALCPDTAVTVNSLLPMRIDWRPAEVIVDMNEKLQQTTHESGTHFLDIHSLFLEQSLNNAGNCFSMDGVHLSGFGYQVWAAGLEAHFKKLDRLTP
jgi:lysophospholipase L1-like esterase